MNNSRPEIADTRQGILSQLHVLEEQIAALRVEFEQFFAGVIGFAPEKRKAEVERSFRLLLKSPLKNAESTFRLRALRYRYNTLDTYWKRVLREREEGRYHKDVFKAKFRKDKKEQAVRANSKAGSLEKQLRTIYDVYTRCLQEGGFDAGTVSFDAFQIALKQRATSLQKANPGKKVKFSVVVKDGKPSVDTSVKE